MYDLMKECNNFFEKTAEYGKFSLKSCASDCVIENVKGKYFVGQKLRIMGSLINDGIYEIKGIEGSKLTLNALYFSNNEEFCGYIVGLAVPKAFEELAVKVKDFENKKNISSESVQGFYSVTYNRSATSGYAAYKNDIATYRKAYVSDYYFLNKVIIYG